MKFLSIRFQKVVNHFKTSLAHKARGKKSIINSYRIISLRKAKQLKKSGNL